MVGVSVPVLAALMLALVLAFGMFYVLVWRETSARRSVALAEWAREFGFYSNPLARLRPPHPLDRFTRPVRVGTCWVSLKCTAVDFAAEAVEGATAEASLSGKPVGETPRPAAPQDASTRQEDDLRAATAPLRKWRHVLVWPIDREWPAIGLRPLGAEDSIVDLLPLPSQAARYGAERFIIHADDRKAAAFIAHTSLRVLLPPDIGLLLLGKFLLLDFSSRPFDGIEINRMIFLAKQLAHPVSAPAGGK